MAKPMIIFAFLLIACMMFMQASAFTDRNGNNCPCATTDDLFPVCGEDGQTYPNESSLDCENSCKQSNIQIRHRGRC